jgi:hypothetical protein
LAFECRDEAVEVYTKISPYAFLDVGAREFNKKRFVFLLAIGGDDDSALSLCEVAGTLVRSLM